jgi:type I restriction enzyme S subunit
VPWIGEVPGDWDLRRAKSLYRQMTRPARESDQVVTCFRDGTVTLRANRRTLGFTNSLKEIGYQGVRKGDLVLHAMDAFAGAVGVSDSDGKCTPVYAVCRAKEDLDNRYYAYVVREMARSQWILALARGIRERSTDFRFNDFGMQVLPVPCIDEQKRMANFLDVHTAKVNHFIRNRRRLIALLNEQKQAIINHAVTRGLDPNVPLKSSGIDWLGEIPEHWETRRLKYLARIETGGRDTIDRRDNGAYPFFVRSQTVERIDTFSYDGEAVLTAGDGAGVAKVFHYINGKFDYHQRVYKFSEFRHVKGHFFFYFFGNTLRFEAFRETAKSTVDSLRLPMLQNFPIPLPSQDEQNRIVAWLDEATSDVDRSLAVARREIDLIREYRTRLIADVVTGKVDVRGFAPMAEEEPLEPEEMGEDVDSEDLPEDEQPEADEGDGDATID